jgi:hypothetical protein
VNETTLVIGLSVALLLAVGLLLFGVGRIFYGIAHYYLRERKPTRRFQHLDLGLFISDGEVWTGEVQQNGRSIRMLIGGTESTPSERLFGQAQSIVIRFSDVERRAIMFLLSRESDAHQPELTFYTLNITDEEHPDDFTFEFADSRDDRVWRVGFISGEPNETGFDD